MSLKPRNNYIVARPVKGQKVSKGGILMPENAKSQGRALQAEIVAVSLGQLDTEVEVVADLKPGQIILYGKFQGYDTEYDGEELIVLDQKDVLAIIQEDKS